MSKVVLSNPFKTRDLAAKAGFAEITKDNRWHLTEFGFWILVKVKGKDVQYYYTKPETDDSTSHITLTLTVPEGYNVSAFCHTHPQSDKVGEFSPDDKTNFKDKIKKYPHIVFYLMNLTGQIRLAENEKGFPKGRSIP